jgi:ADP-dependent phosphofructokinase/glucokinase
MIKIALKHWIYDYCIDMIFNNIGKNFDICKNKKFKIGSRFKCIKISAREFYNKIKHIHIRTCKASLYNCKIINLHKDKNNEPEFEIYSDICKIYDLDYNELKECKNCKFNVPFASIVNVIK